MDDWTGWLMGGGVTALIVAVTGWISAGTSRQQARSATTAAASQEWRELYDEARKGLNAMEARLKNLEKHTRLQDQRIDAQARRWKNLQPVLHDVIPALAWIRDGAVPPPPTVDDLITRIQTASEETPE